MYFDVDYRFLHDGDEQVAVAVDYFDAGPESFEIQYDSSDPALRGIAQQFHPGRVQTIGQTRTWKTAVFVLPRARFANRTNGGDFRLSCNGAELSVGRIAVTWANPNSGDRK
ncbi:MAG TPA: hypothetical protein DD670_13030 [Planctomycetaceae bacterium]|nr:hypothetical protein [Planctomycetaceae bacterium]